MSASQNNLFVTPEERSQIIGASYSKFPQLVETYLSQKPSSELLRESIINASQIGIWAKLNNQRILKYITDGSNFIFAGQQPTMDYSLLRRVPKRMSPYDEIITVYTHADHDRAGKTGFANFKLPIVTPDGIEILNLSWDIDFTHNDLMRDVPKPTRENIISLFELLICQANYLSQSDSGAQIFFDCLNFILENYDLIRSTAELNSVIQSYILRTIEPDHQPLELMLTDLIESPVFRGALAKQILEMPHFITAYNKAVELISKTEYKDIHQLPKPLAVIVPADGEVIYELPLWVLVDHESGTERRSAHLLSRSNLCEIGYYNESGQFIPLISFDAQTTVADLIVDINLSRFSPAAVTLVDALRDKIGIAVVHGQTGHYYEAINEMTAMLMRFGDTTIPDNMVAHPNRAGLAPVTAIHMPIEAVESTDWENVQAFLDRDIQALESQVEFWEENQIQRRGEKTDLFAKLSKLSAELPYKGNKLGNHPLIFAEISKIISSEDSELADLKSVLSGYNVAFANSTKMEKIVETICRLYKDTGYRLIELLDRCHLVKLSDLFSQIPAEYLAIYKELNLLDIQIEKNKNMLNILKRKIESLRSYGLGDINPISSALFTQDIPNIIKDYVIHNASSQEG